MCYHGMRAFLRRTVLGSSRAPCYQRDLLRRLSVNFCRVSVCRLCYFLLCSVNCLIIVCSLSVFLKKRSVDGLLIARKRFKEPQPGIKWHAAGSRELELLSQCGVLVVVKGDDSGSACECLGGIASCWRGDHLVCSSLQPGKAQRPYHLASDAGVSTSRGFPRIWHRES